MNIMRVNNTRCRGCGKNDPHTWVHIITKYFHSIYDLAVLPPEGIDPLDVVGLCMECSRVLHPVAHTLDLRASSFHGLDHGVKEDGTTVLTEYVSASTYQIKEVGSWMQHPNLASRYHRVLAVGSRDHVPGVYGYGLMGGDHPPYDTQAYYVSCGFITVPTLYGDCPECGRTAWWKYDPNAIMWRGETCYSCKTDLGVKVPTGEQMVECR